MIWPTKQLKFKIYTAHTTQSQKISTWLKMDRKPEDVGGQQADEKTLNTTNHQREANQKQNETPFHTWQNGYHQKSTNNNVGEHTDKKNLCAPLVGM